MICVNKIILYSFYCWTLLILWKLVDTTDVEGSILCDDYRLEQQACACLTGDYFHLHLQMKGLHASLDRRISDLEKLKQANASDHAEATE